jgi:broad specificity phosphatase PhoE/2'-5' RNA ligase
MLNINFLKEQIKSVIVNKLSSLESIISITFVGSFESSSDISLISDIDIIVILDELSGTKFKQIEAIAGSIKSDDIGLAKYRIKLNMTFGPLKFNDRKTVVFHIMVYDIKGHRKHVLESPFTCLDWEFFPAIYGKNLSDIYPASGVQLDDLLKSRRGLEAYLDDLKKQIISYREYDFSTKIYTEKKYTFQIDDRHQKEYAYHILKFLQINLLKILFQENKRYSITELTETFNSLNPSFKIHSDFLIELHSWKYENTIEPDLIVKRLEEFIKDLSIWLEDIKYKKLTFFRHGKTQLNDGSFLGVRRNPSIINLVEIIHDEYFDEIYTGTLARTVETGMLLNSKVFNKDELLNEIDYGLAEGMKLNEFSQEFPEIVKAWKKNEDPEFPDGECQLDVYYRLQKFIKKNFTKNNIAVVTHNVVLRCLLGKVFNQNVSNWYKMNPNHLEAHNFFIFNDVLIPVLTKEQQKKYKDELVSFSEPIVQYGVFWIPSNELCEYVESLKNRLRNIEPDAMYLNHPVHSTIFLFNANEQDQSEIILSIKRTNFNCQVETWKIFNNDLITHGDTLTLGLKPTSLLLQLQSEIAETLLKFVKKPVNYTNLWDGKLKESYERYGFPFVGSHWIPHLTIASVKKEGKKFIDKIKLTPSKLHGKEFAGSLVLYKISENDHQIIHSWK